MSFRELLRATTIQFELKEKSQVNIEVYNSIGERVAELDNTTRDPGICKYAFSARNEGYASGVYFVKVKINNALTVLKLIELE